MARYHVLLKEHPFSVEAAKVQYNLEYGMTFFTDDSGATVASCDIRVPVILRDASGKHLDKEENQGTSDA